MRTDPLAYIGLCLLAWFLYLAFGITDSWPQQIPLEYDLDGMQDQASEHNFSVLSSAKATVRDATVMNATWDTGFILQGFAYGLVGGASGQVLEINDAAQVIPGDTNSLIHFSQLPAFAVATATGTPVSATASDGVLYLAGAGGVTIGVDESAGIVTIGDTGGYVPRDAYSRFAVRDSAASATAFTSQFHIIEATNVDLVLDPSGNSLMISATIEGSGNGVPTTVVAASDAIHWVSADWRCDGDTDSGEILNAAAWVGDLGGIVYLTEGAFSDGASIATTQRNVRIQGNGWHTVINHAFSGAMFSTYRAPSVMNDGREFQDMTLVGNSGTYPTSGNLGIYIYLTSPVTLRNLRMYDFGDSALEWYTSSGKDKFFLYNTLIQNSGAADTYGSTLNFSSRATIGAIHDLFLLDNPKTAINAYTRGSNSYWAMLNVITYSTAQEAQVNLPPTVQPGCLSIDDDGDALGTGTYSLVSGMYVYSPGDDGFITNTSGMIFGNSIQQPAAKGTSSETTKPNQSLSYNTAYQTGTNGLYLYNACDRSAMLSNFVNGCGSTQMLAYAGGSYFLIAGNYVANGGSYGIYIGHTSLTGSTWYATVGDNVFYNNGSTGSNAALYLRGSSPGQWLRDNVFYDTAGTSYRIANVGNVGFNASKDIQSEGNYFGPGFAGAYQWSTYAGAPELREVAQMTTSVYADVYVLESSAPARIGLATRTEINNILTVGSNAPTNPIATSWTLHSDPGLKESILPWKDKSPRIAALRKMRNCEITFDWRYQEGKREELGWDISHPDFPEHLKSYNAKGKAVGINQSQLLADLYAAAEYLTEETARLRQEIAALRSP